MFTGIVQAVGEVETFSKGRLVIRALQSWWSGKEGDSVAVNGCCLTVVGICEMANTPACDKGVSRRHRSTVPMEEWHALLSFDLSEETLARTNMGQLKQGFCVNLETAATISTIFGGHIVQGHVDCTGQIVKIQPRENSTVLRIQAPLEGDRYLIDKGSITVDGISLTVVEPVNSAFDTWIIPHTLAHTNLKDRQTGDLVNLEFDVIAKHVDKLLAYRNHG